MVRIQEMALEAISKKQKVANKNLGGNTSFPKPLSPSTLVENGKKQSTTLFQKISPRELQYRKAHNLCFKCGEKYGPGHVCSKKEIHMLISESKDEDNELFLTEEELIEYNRTSGNKRHNFQYIPCQETLCKVLSCKAGIVGNKFQFSCMETAHIPLLRPLYFKKTLSLLNPLGLFYEDSQWTNSGMQKLGT